MKLAVSNIAWTNEEEPQVAALLQSLGVRYVEVAPTKLWQDPTQATNAQVRDYAAFWRGYGIEVVAFQSMLFTRPDLKLFESESNRAETLRYLQDFTRLAGRMGAGVLVFGSPKNRQRGAMAEADALAVAADFFGRLGQTAREAGTRFCIEPNPTAYDCDFVTDAAAGAALVQAVADDGFGLHLDIAGMTLAGDDVAASIERAAPVLRHFHISVPYLEQVEDTPDVAYRESAGALRAIDYRGYVSIEMKPAAAGGNLARVEKAVRFAQAAYAVSGSS